MASLPSTVGVPFIRTDFSNLVAWQRMKSIVDRPDEQGYQASVE